MARLIGTFAALCLAMVISVGCAAYANYPSIGDDAAVNDPNIVPLPELVTRSLVWVVDAYPVEGGFVVNLPEGMDRKKAALIAERVGRGAELVSPESTGLPVYHVTRIRLRGDRGEVDVLRPVSGAGGAHQMVTVRLGSRFGTWEVRTTKVWPVGAGDVPPLYGWSEKE